MMNKKTLLVVAALFSASNTDAYTNSVDLRRKFGVTTSKNNKSKSSSPTVSPQQQKKTNTIAHAALDTDPFASNTMGSRRQSPSSPLNQPAHGILSPETVARMVENTANGRNTNPAVEHFLTTYKRKGPMSCLEMLSDPEVLPHLTQAMRDVL